MTTTKIAKRCGACAAALVVRWNHVNHAPFLGCERWPDCTHTEPLPTDQRMRLAGAPMLPGIEETQ